MYWGYKIRIFPTKEQEELILKHINGCRYVWNYMLALQEKRYHNGEKHLSGYAMSYVLTGLKHNSDHDWLNNLSYASMNKECMILADAYDRYFKKIARRPKFKSKKTAKKSYPVRNNSIVFYDDCVSIEKVGKIKYQTSYDIPKGRGIKFCESSISYVNGKWILSVSMIRENQAYQLTDIPMGIDLGIKELAIIAHGENKIIYHNINKSKRIKNQESKLNHLRRNVSRKYKQNGNYKKTKNIIRAEQKVAKASARITNTRHDYIHKTTHEIVEMKPMIITMETLGLKNMTKNHCLAKSLNNQMLGEFIKQMKYKAEYRKIPFVQADRFYPSSKTCSNCGAIKKDLKLKDRLFVCNECHFEIDRDYNAAINLMKYGLSQ